jgi:amino acid permease
MELPLRLAHMWWAGFKVLCRWAAFLIVLTILWLPTVALVGLVGDYVGQTLGVAFLLLVAPMIFYLTSKYLLLLGDESQDAVADKEHPTDASERRGYGLRKKITISTAVAFLSSAIYAPPDPLSILVLGTMAAFLCSVPLLILSRFQFMKSASSRVQTLVCVLVYLVAMLATLGYVLLLRIYR